MEQRIIMVNLVQCWQCKQYIPPGDEIRVRTMRTAVEVGNGLNSGRSDRYEPVSLCVQCDQAAALEFEKEGERNARYARVLGWTIGGWWMAVALRTLSLPWAVAMLGAAGLAWLGILGRTVVLIGFTQMVIEIAYGQPFSEICQPYFVSASIVAMLVAKFGRRITQRTQQRQLSQAE